METADAARRYIMKRLLLLALSLVLVLATALPGFAAKSRFRAELSGTQEVPSVKTDASGTFKLTIYKDGLSFELNVDDLMNPVAAYIHKGKKGENGPPIAGLFGGPMKAGEFSGVLAVGTITEESLLGELQGKRIADLVRLVKSGNTYVNILTETFPVGEIRGQIK
jgi:hypothetical protein